MEFMWPWCHWGENNPAALIVGAFELCVQIYEWGGVDFCHFFSWESITCSGEDGYEYVMCSEYDGKITGFCNSHCKGHVVVWYCMVVIVLNRSSVGF